jgi:uncharacterized protein
MQFQSEGRSDNVEDRRGLSPKVAAGGGVAIIAMLVAAFFGLDPNQVKKFLGQVQGGAGGGQAQGPNPKADPNDPFKIFSEKLMYSMEEVWGDVFQKAGERYQKPKMVIFSEAVSTGGCGNAPSAVGPFYCPADKTLYLDPSFFEELEKKLGGSKADFSKSYVVAHEVGHHVQNLLGYSAKVDAARKTAEANEMSVRLELQADFLAGVWAHHAVKKGLIKIDNADIAEALKSAKSIGDDVLQKRSQGWTSPESYTHGTADQRFRYFSEGLKSGDLSKLKFFFDARYNQL